MGGFKNEMQVPKIKKICISSSISKKKPVIVKSKKSISGFNIRKNMSMGCKVTLRRKIMYEFLDRMINIALPRIKDFRGISINQFDGKGNLSIGIKENLIFTEIKYEKLEKIRGINIVIVTSSNKDKEAKLLLEEFN